jgi:four helix bundle protein
VARRVEDFACWQLMDALRRRVYAITDDDRVRTDWKFRDQMRDAAASSLRNFAEGYGRISHRDFARFLRITRGSLFEVSECLRDGAARGYWTSESVADIEVLAKRATAAISRLMEYLLSTPDR